MQLTGSPVLANNLAENTSAVWLGTITHSLSSSPPVKSSELLLLIHFPIVQTIFKPSLLFPNIVVYTFLFLKRWPVFSFTEKRKGTPTAWDHHTYRLNVPPPPPFFCLMPRKKSCLIFGAAVLFIWIPAHLPSEIPVPPTVLQPCCFFLTSFKYTWMTLSQKTKHSVETTAITQLLPCLFLFTSQFLESGVHTPCLCSLVTPLPSVRLPAPAPSVCLIPSRQVSQ